MTKKVATSKGQNKIDWRFHAGRGLEDARHLFQPTLSGDSIDDVLDWYYACEAVDEDSRNKKELIDLLKRENGSFPVTARICVADLLERHRLLVHSQFPGIRGDPKIVVEEVTKEKSEIIRQLVSDETFSREQRMALVELLVTCELKRRRGKQKTPTYRLPNSEWVLELACYEIYRRRRSKVRIEDAIAQVATERGLKPDVLRNAWAGRRGYTRELERRERLRLR